MQFIYNNNISNISIIGFKQKNLLRAVVLQFFFASVILTSCEKFVDVGPPTTQLIGKTVFTSDVMATAAISGIYIKMIESSIGLASGTRSITLVSGLYSDELLNYSTAAGQSQFFGNSLGANNEYVNGIWIGFYQSIYAANAVLEGIANSSEVSGSTKKQLEGEAKFIRGFCHFYLLNLFGEIPYATTTDYKVNAVSVREPIIQAYEHIVADLIDAENLLSEDYSFSNGERIRPNKSAARALLARTYLYTKDWVNAEALATTTINNSALYSIGTSLNSIANLNSVFLKNSNESIWQLRPVNPGYNTYDAFIFVLTYGPNTYQNTVSLSDPQLNAFETGDNRKSTWVGTYAGPPAYYYPYKYKILSSPDPNAPVNEYLTVLRLAEQFLIRAEARAHQNKLNESIADVDVIRDRAGLPLISNTNPSINQDDLLLAIEKERRVELFAEWGHRWFDLKRTQRADAVLESKSGWQLTDTLFPIPQLEIASNPNLTQNAGY